MQRTNKRGWCDFARPDPEGFANLAVNGLDTEMQNFIDLVDLGTATGKVPASLHTFQSIENSLDSTPQIVSKTFGLGGVRTSPGYLSAIATGRDYSVVRTSFDVRGDPFNHSLPYYFVDPITRSELGFGELTPTLRDLYSTGPWLE